MLSDTHCLAQLRTTRNLALELKAIAAQIHLKIPETQELALLVLFALTGKIRAEVDVEKYLPQGNRAAVACQHILREGDLYKQPISLDAFQAIAANERPLKRLNETTRDSLPEPVIAAFEAIIQAARQLQEVIDFESTVEGVRRIVQAAEQLQRAIEGA